MTSWLGFVRFIAAFLAVIVTFPACAEMTGKARVVDGDTLDVGGRRVRLHGIDAPESRQTCTANGKPWNCGQEAMFALAYLVGNHWITCKERDKDSYGRIVAVCYAGPYDLNARMVRDGWALANRSYSTDYVDEEATARTTRAGIWRGDFMVPWRWRMRKHGATSR